MRRLLVLGLVIGLSGCGADVKVPEKPKITEVTKGTLDCLTTLEGQMTSGSVKRTDYQKLVTSAKWLAGRMKADNVGTDQQRQELEALRQQLARAAGGPSLPPPDWRPDSGQATPEAKIDARPLQEILPKIRQLVESIQ